MTNLRERKIDSTGGGDVLPGTGISGSIVCWDPRAGGTGEEAVGHVPPLTENFNEGVRVIPVEFLVNISAFI